MRNNRVWKLMLMLAMSAILVLAMTACGDQEEAAPEEDAATSTAAELSDADFASLMEQVAKEDVNIEYSDYLTDEAFATAEIFGIDRDGNAGTAYATLCDGDYVVLKDKAYQMTGSQGEVIIKFDYTDDGPALTELIWSADGGDHDAWLEENYPADYLAACKEYDAYDENGASLLNKELIKMAEEALGVPVETENLLEIDLDAGTYKITKTIESGDPGSEDYTFDVETVESGNLSDL